MPDPNPILANDPLLTTIFVYIVLGFLAGSFVAGMAISFRNLFGDLFRK